MGENNARALNLALLLGHPIERLKSVVNAMSLVCHRTEEVSWFSEGPSASVMWAGDCNMLNNFFLFLIWAVQLEEVCGTGGRSSGICSHSRVLTTRPGLSNTRKWFSSSQWTGSCWIPELIYVIWKGEGPVTSAGNRTLLFQIFRPYFSPFRPSLCAGLAHESIQAYSGVAFVEAQPGNQIILCGETALTAAERDTFT